MLQSETFQIPLSKPKITKVFFFSLVFVFIGLWMIISKPQISNPVLNNPVVKIFVSYGAVIMGVLGVYFYGRKLFNTGPGLLIDQHGIHDNTSIFDIGVIEWTDISNISEGSVQASLTSKQRFVTVELLDPDKYITREKNLIKRKLLLANSRSYGSPVHISTSSLQTSHSELLRLLKQQHAIRVNGNSFQGT